jgi:hypothetical protein
MLEETPCERKSPKCEEYGSETCKSFLLPSQEAGRKMLEVLNIGFFFILSPFSYKQFISFFSSWVHLFSKAFHLLLFFFSFSTTLGIELRSLSLLSKCLATYSIPPVLFLLVCFSERGLHVLPGLVLNLEALPPRSLEITDVHYHTWHFAEAFNDIHQFSSLPG